jgi:hypothetical protein
VIIALIAVKGASKSALRDCRVFLGVLRLARSNLFADSLDSLGVGLSVRSCSNASSEDGQDNSGDLGEVHFEDVCFLG